MKQYFYLILILIITTQILMGTQCRKENIAFNPRYEFQEKLSLTPYKKIYSINDTIWVQFQTANKSLYDRLSNSQIIMDTTSLSVRFLYHKRYIVETQPEYFCEVNIDNSLNPSLTTLYSWYNEINLKTICDNQLVFRAGFVPKKIGVYSLEPRLIVNECPNKVNRSLVTSSFIFDLSDCNKDVWLSIPEQYRRSTDPESTVRSIDAKEIFVFKVQ
jgi:hypothetical protein